MIIGPEVFIKKQAETQFKKNVERVKELREIIRTIWPPVTAEGVDFIGSAQRETEQIHLLGMFMLDICGGSVTLPLDSKPNEPLEIA